jgi:uncharacterized integral membrane protein
MAEGGNRINKAKTVLVIFLAIIALVLILQNVKPVETRILFMTVKMPRAMLLIVTLLIGFALGAVTAGRFMAGSSKGPKRSGQPGERAAE